MIFSSDNEIKQFFTQKVLQSLEKYPDLAEEIASMMENRVIQRVVARNSSFIENVKQNTSGITKVCQEVMADGSIIKGVEQTQNVRD